MEDGVIEKTFECFNCKKSKLTVQMKPDKSANVKCRVCDQEYQVTCQVKEDQVAGYAYLIYEFKLDKC